MRGAVGSVRAQSMLGAPCGAACTSASSASPHRLRWALGFLLHIVCTKRLNHPDFWCVASCPQATEDGAQLLCPAPADSLVGLVHCRLLEVVSPLNLFTSTT